MLRTWNRSWSFFVAGGVMLTTGALGVIRPHLGSGTWPALGAMTRSLVVTQAPPTWDYAMQASGYPLERSACFTLRLGAQAAAQCGDLRVTHALPAVRVYNTALAPTLVYNAEHAHPVVATPLLITQGASTTRPDSVEVIVAAGAGLAPKVPKDTLRWAGSEWGASGTAVTRRVTVSYDALNDTTGLYLLQFTVTNIYPGNVRVPSPAVFGGSRIVVNRKDSPFGAGWWLAGHEQVKKTIHNGEQQYLWIGGDGSARQFSLTNVLAYDRYDSLRFDAGSQRFVRRLPEGRRVEFDATGQHVQTINRFGRITQYAYSGVNQVQSITLPAPTGLSYTFGYSGTPARVATITAPPLGGTARVVTLQNATGVLTQITNPGDSPVLFAYHTSGGTANVLHTRTDRRGVATTFTFDSALKVRSATVDPGGGAGLIVWTVKAGESRGLPKSETAPTPSSVDTTQSATWIDGPRTDLADITLVHQGRFGPARRIANALGDTTTIRVRLLGDQTLGAPDNGWLAWRVEQPAGTTAAPATRVQRVAYELPRGNVVLVKDSGSTSLAADSTRYRWDQSFDQLLTVVPPMRDSTVFGVNTDNGRREWEQDVRGPVSRIIYHYDEQSFPEQMTRLVLPGTNTNLPATTVFTYHATLRNTKTETTPRLLVRTDSMDTIGRITKTLTPIDSNPSSTAKVERRLSYSLRDDVIADTTMSGAESIRVINTYDAEGNLTQVDRAFAPDPRAIGTMTLRSRFDNAGRLRAAEAPDGRIDSTVYDEAGNVRKQLNRRFTIGTKDSAQYTAMTYDALNRLQQRRIPAYQYSTRAEGIGNGTYPGQGAYPAYSILEDVQSFQYDRAGHLVVANNKYAQVSRGYDRGRLLTETLRIANVAANSFTQHVYTSSYRYDANARRTVLKLPSTLTAVGKDSIRYLYNSWNGGVSSVVGLRGDIWSFEYDTRNRLIRQYNDSTRISQSWLYSDEDAVQLDSIYNPTAGFPRYPTQPLRRTRLLYDGRNKVLHAVAPAIGARDTLLNTYTGLGYLATTRSIQRATGSIASDSVRYGAMQQLTYDGLGNIVYEAGDDTTRRWGVGAGTSIAGSARTVAFKPGVGRDTSSLAAFDATRYSRYDAAGNVVFMTKKESGVNPIAEDRASFYDAAGQLSATDTRRVRTGPSAQNINVLEHYRYDALGRRIWVRAEKSCWTEGSVAPNALCLAAYIRRVIWDGQQEVAEIQVPGASTYSSLHENDTGPYQVAPFDNYDLSPYFGRVVYTHGQATDQPLTVTRYGYTDVPNVASPAYVTWPTFALVPLWTFRGQPALGTFGNGNAFAQYTAGGTKCNLSVPLTAQRCVKWEWQWFDGPYNSQRGRYLESWQGSLLEDKKDASGTYYRRARTYDAATGRFTQEDPIGLAGGLNLYGYAGGDPVNFSDPFGLCPGCGGAIAHAVMAANAARAQLDVETDFMFGMMGSIGGGSTLARNIVKAGSTRGIQEAAHHIVAKGARAAAPAKQVLKEVGIGIDDAINGVFLPAAKDYAGKAANHLNVHTKKYYEAVNKAFANVTDRAEAVQVLDRIRRGLLEGTFPR